MLISLPSGVPTIFGQTHFGFSWIKPNSLGNGSLSQSIIVAGDINVWECILVWRFKAPTNLLLHFPMFWVNTSVEHVGLSISPSCGKLDRENEKQLNFGCTPLVLFGHTCTTVIIITLHFRCQAAMIVVPVISLDCRSCMLFYYTSYSLSPVSLLLAIWGDAGKPITNHWTMPCFDQA